MKICLVILYGWGHNKNKTSKDAIQDSKCPNMRYLSKRYQSFLIHASGIHVGLHDKCMGNSEVGHLTLGSGRVIKQNIILIDEEFKNGKIRDRLLPLIRSVKRLHLIGLVSDGGIHSHIDHLKGLIKLLHGHCDEILIHCISDGRDTAPNVFLNFLSEIEDLCASYKNCHIVSIGGRFFAMDRDNNVDRINEYFNTVINNKNQDDITKYVQNQYRDGRSDENILPALFDDRGIIDKQDTILLFNFRADRMRQITKKFVDSGFKVYTMTEYDKSINADVIFKPIIVKNTLADILEDHGIEQVHIAETEKYAHVTYFFNGGNERCHIKEERIIVDSKKAESFAKIPEMSSEKIADEIIKNVHNNKQFIVANFAAPDMVGHTGDYEATCKAIEFIDEQIGRIYEECNKNQYVLIITADHGNAEVMYDEENQVINKKHTNNKIPLILTIDRDVDKSLLYDEKSWGYEDSEYTLSDVAPTILDLFRIEIPEDITGSPIRFTNEINE